MYYRNKKQVVRIRYVYFIIGALLGLTFSLSSQKLLAFDENGQFVLQKTFTLISINLLQKVAVAQVVMNRIEHSSYVMFVMLYMMQNGIRTKATIISDINVSLVGSVMANQMNH